MAFQLSSVGKCTDHAAHRKTQRARKEKQEPSKPPKGKRPRPALGLRHCFSFCRSRPELPRFGRPSLEPSARFSRKAHTEFGFHPEDCGKIRQRLNQDYGKSGMNPNAQSSSDPDRVRQSSLYRLVVPGAILRPWQVDPPGILARIGCLNRRNAGVSHKLGAPFGMVVKGNQENTTYLGSAILRNTHVGMTLDWEPFGGHDLAGNLCPPIMWEGIPD